MSDVFKIYEDSLNISINNIKRILNKKDFNNDDISKLSDNLKESKRLIKQMNLEISSLKNSNKFEKEIENKFTNYQTTIENYSQEIYRIQNNFNNNSKTFNSNIMLEGNDSESNRQLQKMGLIENEDGFIIDEMQREAYKIEDIGKNINYNLNQQGEQMQSIRNNIIDLNKDIDQSNTLINKLLKRENRNRCIVYLIIIIAVVLLFIYYYYF
jgi:hypothetical protein